VTRRRVGRKARDRIEHFLRAAIDNSNTRQAYGRALGSFFSFLEDGGRERVQRRAAAATSCPATRRRLPPIEVSCGNYDPSERTE